MQGKILGPLRPQEFLDTYLPETAFPEKKVPLFNWDNVKDNFRLKTTKVFRGKVHETPLDFDKCIERDMYAPLIKAIESCITSSFECLDTNAKPDKKQLKNCPASAPGLTGYEKSRCHGQRIGDSDSSLSDWVVEVKKGGPDPFEKSPGPYLQLKKTDEGEPILGQLTHYVVSQFAHQYRTHVFSVFIRGPKARLFRWDHAGALVTEEFDYAETPHLAEFFHRYTRATPEARGHDTTVRRYPFGYKLGSAGAAREQLDLEADEPVYKFQVWDDDEEKPYFYYGGDPFYNGVHSITGRATRTIKVWDPILMMTVMLKDQWRVNSLDIKSEGEIYKLLQKEKVRNIPTCLRAGDVNPNSGFHSTQTQRLAPAGDNFRSHIHSRLVMEEVCKGIITDFTDTKQLVSVLRDALIAHHDAYDRAKLLHRDVSSGNILITEKGKGLLSDWEFCKPISELGSSKQLELTGTWQFISAALLQSTQPQHRLQDDLESFFHVLSWTSLRYVRNNLCKEELDLYLHDVYDQTMVKGDTVVGGYQKIDKMGSRALSKCHFEPAVIHTLIADFEATFATRYPADDLEPEQEELDDALARYEAAADTKRPYLARREPLLSHFAREHLKSGTWMVKRCNEALGLMGSPTDILPWIKNKLPQDKPPKRGMIEEESESTKTTRSRSKRLRLDGIQTALR